MSMMIKILLLVIGIPILLITIFSISTGYGDLFVSAIWCIISPTCGSASPSEITSATTKAITTNNIKECNRLPKEQWFSASAPRGECYYKYAIATNNTQTCNDMSTFSATSSGKDDCYVQIATQTGNVVLCDTLKEFDPYLRDPYSDFERYALQCYSGVAQKQNNKFVCNKLSGDNRLYCLIPFSDRSICTQFTKEESGFCYEKFDQSR